MKQSKTIAGFLIAWLTFLMLATRADHFGSAINLPDGSLAVFFMAGFLFKSRWIFPVLCLLAAAIDYWMIEYNGVSAFCVTSAYGFLVPTYFVMWWSGAYCQKLDLSLFRQWLGMATVIVLATATAHLISSGSFYLLAPYFTEHSLVEFGRRTALYFPRYLMVTSAYLAAMLTLWKLAVGSNTASIETRGISNG